MKLLILGGTHFLGRHLVEAARARGHVVTLFNRGRTAPELFPDVEKLHGDRDGDLVALRGRRWDAVIDTCGYVPRIVRASAALLAGSVEHYTFISSISAYAHPGAVGVDEDAPVEELDDPENENVAEAYGALKAACERAIETILPGRVLTVRSGLLVGPHDPTDRFTYWPWRVAQGGLVLAPGRPERQIQLIDARDMSDWIVRMVEGRQTGVYNVTGPADTLTMGQLLESCCAATRSEARFEWVDEGFLLEQGISPFRDLPLWLPEADNGMLEVNINRALAAGLSFRPLEETIQETLAWHESRSPGSQPGGRASGWAGQAGLAPERESALLAAWLASAG